MAPEEGCTAARAGDARGEIVATFCPGSVGRSGRDDATADGLASELKENARGDQSIRFAHDITTRSRVPTPAGCAEAAFSPPALALAAKLEDEIRI